MNKVIEIHFKQVIRNRLHFQSTLPNTDNDVIELKRLSIMLFSWKTTQPLDSTWKTCASVLWICLEPEMRPPPPRCTGVFSTWSSIQRYRVRACNEKLHSCTHIHTFSVLPWTLYLQPKFRRRSIVLWGGHGRRLYQTKTTCPTPMLSFMRYRDLEMLSQWCGPGYCGRYSDRNILRSKGWSSDV